MAEPNIQITHIATFVHSLGGLQTVVRHHLATDARWGHDTRAVAAFEGAEQPALERVALLGLTRYSTIAQARAAMAAQLSSRPPGVVIYHDLWGLPLFADLDRATRRVGWIHCPAPQILEVAWQNHELLDGVVSNGQPTVEAVRRELPHWATERIAFVPLPIDQVDLPVQRAPLAGRPIVLGYSGRLIKSLKRVDRLPELCRLLAQSRVSFRLEILGEGPDERWLREQFRGCANVLFHGRQEGARYWQILGGWDAIVYVSDVEGMGLALLEGLSVGVLPFYPKIGGGEDYVRSVEPKSLYESGDLAQLARLIRDLSQTPAKEIEALRLRCRAAVAPHLSDGYQKVFSSFVRQIDALPRLSVGAFAPRPFSLSDHAPLGVLRHLWPRAFWRRSWRGQAFAPA